MSISDYGEGQMLGLIPSPCYVQLHTADPGEAGTTSPVAGAPRQSVTLAAASGGQRVTNADVSWAAWSFGTVAVTHISVWDDPTVGNCWWSGALTVARTVSNTDT